LKTPSIFISWGELFDRISILQIKSKKITNENSKINVDNELNQLNRFPLELFENNFQDPFLESLVADLSVVNEMLWDTEDKLRQKESLKLFDSEFIELARSVYHQNDRRSTIKRQINERLKSDLAEEKLYSNY